VTQKPDACGLWIESFNGKPQALPTDFACAFASPLNENDQYATQSTPRQRVLKLRCSRLGEINLSKA
jgi:hypothetical protein